MTKVSTHTKCGLLQENNQRFCTLNQRSGPNWSLRQPIVGLFIRTSPQNRTTSCFLGFFRFGIEWRGKYRFFSPKDAQSSFLDTQFIFETPSPYGIVTIASMTAKFFFLNPVRLVILGGFGLRSPRWLQVWTTLRNFRSCLGVFLMPQFILSMCGATMCITNLLII